ncbi:MAG: CpXC domain-containing protein [Caldimonas sp.]
MSRIHTESFPCNHCGKPLEMGIVASINADRRPDLREGVLDGTFQRGKCAACGNAFRAEPELTYLDVARRQWILVQPARQLGQWNELEAMARSGFANAYGEEAPEGARRIGAGMSARIAFGWAAFREKLLAAEHKLDDVTLELLKFAVLRGLEDAPVGDDIELRLSKVAATELELVWCSASGELAIESMTVPRGLYDEIAADPEGEWAPLRAEVSAGPFVDMNRLLVEIA